MKIILSNKEAESFLGYLEKQMSINIELASITNPYAKELFEGKTYLEIIDMMYGHLIITDLNNKDSRLAYIYKSGDEYIAEVREDIFVAYTESLAKYTDALMPYSMRVALAIKNNIDDLSNIGTKLTALRTLLSNKMIKKGIDFIANMLGIENFVKKITYIITDIMEDEVLKEKLQSISDEFDKNVLGYEYSNEDDLSIFE